MVGCVIVLKMRLGQDRYALSAETKTERESEVEKECIGKFRSSVIILVLKFGLVSCFLEYQFFRGV